MLVISEVGWTMVSYGVESMILEMYSAVVVVVVGERDEHRTDATFMLLRLLECSTGSTSTSMSSMINLGKRAEGNDFLQCYQETGYRYEQKSIDAADTTSSVAAAAEAAAARRSCGGTRPLHIVSSFCAYVPSMAFQRENERCWQSQVKGAERRPWLLSATI